VAISHKYPLEVYYIDNAYRGNKAELHSAIAVGDRQRKREMSFSAVRLPNVYLGYSSSDRAFFSRILGDELARGWLAEPKGCVRPPTATATIRSFYKMPLSRAGRAVRIAIVRITMPPPDDEYY